jgi:hypothetical protein
LSVDSPSFQNTRQEVIRVDYDLRANWKLTGRYTHDLSETQELGGLFAGITVPGIATTDTSVPGTIGAVSLRNVIGNNKLNEIQYHFSSNKISTQPAEGVRQKRAEFGINIAEVFPENNAELVPTFAVAGIATVGANQLIRIQYLNSTITDTFTWQRGDHAFKFGGLASFEQKNENAINNTQGSFNFVATANGPTAFQSFLRGNPNNACAACTYTEAEKDLAVVSRLSPTSDHPWTWRSIVRVLRGDHLGNGRLPLVWGHPQRR